jgi:hypothetical protein
MRPCLKVCGFFCLILLSGKARAAFSDDLSDQDRSASGLGRLTSAQVAKVNKLVANDLDLAREGAVTAFATPFSRRHAKEISATGFDRLTAAQILELDKLVAFTLAHPVPELPHFHPHSAAAVSAAPPANPTPPLQLAEPPWQVHGDITLAVGGGKGGSFFGSSLDLFVTDPSGRFTAAISLSEFRGKGWSNPCFYPPLSPWAPYSLRFPYPQAPLPPPYLLPSPFSLGPPVQ